MKCLTGSNACVFATLVLFASCTSEDTSTSTVSEVDTPAASPELGFDAELLGQTQPEADFFDYVNGKWIAATPIPAEFSSYGVTHIVFERTEEQIRELVENLPATDSANFAERTINNLYSAFLDETRVNERGLSPLQSAIERIDSITTHEDVWRAFGDLQRVGVNVPVQFFTETDANDPDRLLPYFWQGGLGLPDRDYYLSDAEKLVTARTAYVQHIDAMYRLAGWDSEAVGNRLLELETRLARIQWSRVQNRDRERIYGNQRTLAQADAASGPYNWSVMFSALGIDSGIEPLVLAQDSYFEALPELITATDVALWREYLRFGLLKAFAPYLNQAIVDEDFDFQGKTLRGQEALRPRWKRGIAFVNRSAGELLGQLYVAAHFPESSKAQIKALVENLRGAFAASIDELDWMTPATKEAAKAKLAAFRAKLGYPDHWRDYEGLETDATALVESVWSVREFNHEYEVEKLNAPTDRSEWGMSPQTVNAYYRPTFNEIVFPAAILQPPFFNAAADPAANYGAIGAVIGHEFSHGFDDQGRKFDGTGRLRDWWQESDATAYESRAAQLVAQYESFSPLPDTKINGRLTLGENIADLAGLAIAYKAYQRSLGDKPAPVIDGFTGDQRFFISYAQSWRGHMREERLRELLLSDPHAPGRYRVLGVLRNIPEFQRAFGVTEGDAMYLPPEQQVQIW